MNVKLKKLAIDAGIGFTIWDDSGREMIDNYTPEGRLEKFAELIVAECIEVFGRDLPEPGDGKMLEVINRICNVAEHFGVEE